MLPPPHNGGVRRGGGLETPIPGDVCSDPVLLGREFFAPRVEFEPLTTFDDF